MAQTIRVYDRICVRDRPWRVVNVQAVGGGTYFVEMEALDGEEPSSPTVVVSPDSPLEEIIPLSNEQPMFHLGQLDSFSAWATAHRRPGRAAGKGGAA